MKGFSFRERERVWWEASNLLRVLFKECVALDLMCDLALEVSSSGQGNGESFLMILQAVQLPQQLPLQLQLSWGQLGRRVWLLPDLQDVARAMCSPTGLGFVIRWNMWSPCTGIRINCYGFYKMKIWERHVRGGYRQMAVSYNTE